MSLRKQKVGHLGNYSELLEFLGTAPASWTIKAFYCKAVLWQSIYTPVKALSMGLATQVNWNQALKDTFHPCGEKVHGSGKRWHSKDPLTVLGPVDLGAVSSKSGWWALGNDIDIRHGPRHFFNMPFLLFQLSLFLFICFFNDLNLISLR